MDNNHDGWIGSRSALMHYLDIMHADRNEEGEFILYGEPIVVGLDDQEIVVPSGTMYSVGGRRCKLAAGLSNTTSQGMKVKVY